MKNRFCPSVHAERSRPSGWFHAANHWLALALVGLAGASTGCDEEPKGPGLTECQGILTDAADEAGIPFPVDQLGREVLFGARIIAVDDPVDLRLGGLKLIGTASARLTPHDDEKDALSFSRCVERCTRDEEAAPALRVDTRGKACDGESLLLRSEGVLANFGIQHFFGDGWDYYQDYLQATIVSEQITRVERDGQTLLIDVTSELEVARDDPPTGEGKPVNIVTRWYFQPTTVLTPNFKARSLQPGLGLYPGFDLEGNEHLLRAPFDHDKDVRFFVKGVPKAYRPALAEAFGAWNDVLEPIVGRAPLRFEHLEKDDPRFDEVTLGDPRYAVMEWDAQNEANYSGLASLLADEKTGETFAPAIDLQGPASERRYKAWFDAYERVESLRKSGDALQAERFRARALGLLNRDALRDTLAPHLDTEGRRNKGLISRESVPRFDFEPPPAGETFESFLKGLMVELIEHEVGHTLGLDHNFMGSLGADGDDVPTSSVMEYVPRAQRHVARIGPYDHDALGYVYGGKVPKTFLPACTYLGLPSPVMPTLSAECSSEDGGPDAFGFLLEERLGRAMDLLLGVGLDTPAWTLTDLRTQFNTGLFGVAFYATSAEASADTWTNFYSDPARPSEPNEISSFVLTSLHEKLCGADVSAELERKREISDDAWQAAFDNAASAYSYAVSQIEPLGLTLPSCELFAGAD